MMSFDEIASILNISVDEVYRIHKSALMKLSHPKNRFKWEEIKESLRAINDEKTSKYESLLKELEWMFIKPLQQGLK